MFFNAINPEMFRHSILEVYYEQWIDSPGVVVIKAGFDYVLFWYNHLHFGQYLLSFITYNRLYALLLNNVRIVFPLFLIVVNLQVINVLVFQGTNRTIELIICLVVKGLYIYIYFAKTVYIVYIQLISNMYRRALQGFCFWI